MRSSPQTRSVAGALYLSASIMIVAGIALGFVLGPVWFVLVAIGLLDGVFAALFASGRIGSPASQPDPATIAGQDPTYNPYARED